MAEIASANLILLVGAVLLLLGILSYLVAMRLGAPLLLVFLLLGMLAGEDGVLGIRFADTRATYMVGMLALSLILFDGGMRTRLATVRLALGPAVLLASIGVVITAVLTGLASWWWLGLPLLGTLLVGCVLASTDAAAVMLLLRGGGVQVDQRIGALLEVESALNDPMAVMLTLMLVSLLSAGETTIGGMAAFLALQVIVGAAFGLGGGVLAVLALALLPLAEGLRPVLAVALGLVIATAASALDGSALLAAYLAGLVVGNRRPPGIAAVLDFSDALTWFAQIGMFLLIGLLVTPTALLGEWQHAMVVFAALTFVARPVAVALCLAPFRYTWREHVFAAWVGLRGSVAVLLAAIPALARLPQSETYFNLVFIVVLTSLLLQGWTLRRAARALGLLLPARPEPPRAVLDLPGVRDTEIMALPIAPGSPVLHHRLPDWALALLRLSAGQLGPVAPGARFAAGDMLYLLVPPGREAEIGRFFAAEREDALVGLGSFSVDGSARIEDLAAAYGLAAPPVPAGETVAGLFAADYGGLVGRGDRVRLAGLSLVAEEVADGQVVRAGLDLEAAPERREGRHLLRRRLRVAGRRLRRFFSRIRKT